MYRIAYVETSGSVGQNKKIAMHQARIIKINNIAHSELKHLSFLKLSNRNQKFLQKIDWSPINFYFDKMATGNKQILPNTFF